MQFKHKFKPKLLLQKAVAVFTAVTLSLSLAAQSLAAIVWVGNPGSSGKIITDDASDARYGHYNGANGFSISWRVTLYVATTDDGKIDPQKHKPGNGLGYVGTVLYDNFNHNNNVYIQLDQNTEVRFSSVTSRAMDYPYVSLVESSDGKIKNSNSGYDTPIYHTIKNCGLPQYVSTCSADSIKKTVESPKFASLVIEHLNGFLGGYSGYFKPLYAKVFDAGACKIGTMAGDKLDAVIAEKGLAGYDVLLPTKSNGSPNPDCVVEWVCVVEPLLGFQTVKESAFFEANGYTQSGNKQLMMCGFNQPRTTIALDAYAVGYYGIKSASDYSNQAYIDEIRDYFPDFKPYHTWSNGTTEYYKDKGKLRCEISSNIHNCATINYDNHQNTNGSYCGFPVAGSKGPNLKYSTSVDEASTYGGISVYKTEIEAPTEEDIKVYYYVYDPDAANADLHAVLVTDTHDKNAQFKPKTKLTDDSGEEFDVIVLSAYSTKNSNATYHKGILKYYYSTDNKNFIYQTRKADTGEILANDGPLKNSAAYSYLVNDGPFARNLSYYNGFYGFEATEDLDAVVVYEDGRRVNIANLIANNPTKFEEVRECHEYLSFYSIANCNLTTDVLEEANSIHVMVVKLPTVTLDEYCYTYVKPNGVSDDDFMEQIKNDEVQPTKVKKSRRTIKLLDTDGTYVASEDDKLTGEPVHISALAATGNPDTDRLDMDIYDQCPDCEDESVKATKNFIVGAAETDVTTPVDLTKTRHIWVKTVVIEETPPLGESAKDRIKTYDVTQLIEDTQQTVSIKPAFPEHRFTNEFPNENTPEIMQISGASYASVKRTFFELFNCLKRQIFII